MEDETLYKWRIKKLIQKLESAKGAGTSMISLIMPPSEQIAKVNTMLFEEYGTASNIKSRVNRLSVLGAITSAQERLKRYKVPPPNGLVLFVGTVETEKGEKKITIDFEPFKPINTFLYKCDNKFHTEPLNALLENGDEYAFVIIDGHSCLLGVLTGTFTRKLYSFDVDLPPKQGRGGQSQMRFSRLREEKRHNYVRKVAETCTRFFIEENKVKYAGIVLAGLADFKKNLFESDLLDPRIKAKIIAIVDVGYGGQQGFNEAIGLCEDKLKQVRFIQEKNLFSRFFEEIAKDTGKVCFGVKETINTLQLGAVETLLIWENLTEKCPSELTGDGGSSFTEKEEEEQSGILREGGTSLLIDWFIENSGRFGAKLELLSDSCAGGDQFVKGFGGVGGLLRYKVEMDKVEETETNGKEEDLLNDETETPFI